ncbi:sulfotransferase-like domain-containing protein [Streptomyces sp. QTS52]
MSHPLIFLWAHCRSRSTAFLRTMLERGDLLVLHEPFSSIVVQGYAEVGEEKAGTFAELLRLIELAAQRAPVFVKETTEYRYGILDDPRLPHLGTHTFIVRDPEPTLASHYAMNQDVTCAEVGYEHQFEIFDLVRRSTGRPPVVIEAERLVADPDEVVRYYCQETGIPFMPSALSWRPGEQTVWKRTPEWHQDTARSSGFTQSGGHYPTGVHNSAKLARYHAYHLPFYERLRAHAALGRHDRAD